MSGLFSFSLLKNAVTWGAWLARSEEHETLDLRVVNSNPTPGEELTSNRTHQCNQVWLFLFYSVIFLFADMITYVKFSRRFSLFFSANRYFHVLLLKRSCQVGEG